MIKLTFCINTTKFELDYLKLLFHSLKTNLDSKEHEILVFVENDTDAGDVVSFLKTQKSVFSDLTIIRNILPICIGYANNINIMFSKAKHDIVSYLQSDMCVGPNYDTEVLASLKKLGENTILSATRIEPSLHPQSDEKITCDFGLNPAEIFPNFQAFSEFANKQKNHTKITDYFFAPFTLHKQLWNSIGGHDTFFRRSREDSDILYRMTMAGYNIKQCWNAFVYHRSCVSSRGPEWWTKAGEPRAKTQVYADAIERIRYQFKWHNHVTHSPHKNPADYKYNIALNIANSGGDQTRDQATIELVQILQECYDKIYVDDVEKFKPVFTQMYVAYHEYANTLLNIHPDIWEKYKYLYRRCDYEERFSSTPISDYDIVVNVDMNTTFDRAILKAMSHIIHEYQQQLTEPGVYELGENIFVTVNTVTNRLNDNLIVVNPPVPDSSFEIL